MNSSIFKIRKEFQKSYVRQCVKNFQVEIDIRTYTRQHEIAHALGITIEEAIELWDQYQKDEVSAEIRSGS